MTLVADGAGFHVPKGYVYAAISFSLGIEILNQIAANRRRKRQSASASSASSHADAGRALQPNDIAKG
jgi:predicted tellurium resistance membrane protein TerC